MKAHQLTALTFLLATASLSRANQFVDDYGRIHILRDEPRIFCSAFTAIGLIHLGALLSFLRRALSRFIFESSNILYSVPTNAGMPQEWLVGTFGTLYNRASNHYTTGESEYYTMDAQPEDLAILRTKPSISHPACLDASLDIEDCWDGHDLEAVKALPGVNLIIDVTSLESAFIRNSSAILDAPIVHIDSAFDGAVNCLPKDMSGNDDIYHIRSSSDDCYRRSFIDVVNRLYALAEWMNIDTRHDRDLLCKATQRFQVAAEKAQSKGIRFMAASIQNAIYLGIDDLVLFVTNPLQYGTSRTLEELGLPLLWPGLCQGNLCHVFGELPVGYETVTKETYFKSCTNNQFTPDCTKDTLYPVDFWLLEGYGYQQLEDNPEAFKAAFPDPALLAGQYMVFPFENYVFSHRSLAGWLDAFAARIDKSSRIHERTPCKAAHVTSLQHINFGSPLLGGGEYACWNPQFHNSEYATCPPVSNTEGLSSGAVTGLVVGAVFVGAAIMFVLMKFILGYHTGIDKTFTDVGNNSKDINSQSEVSTAADAAQN